MLEVLQERIEQDSVLTHKDLSNVFSLQLVFIATLEDRFHPKDTWEVILQEET
jgi:hypothetical protein